MKKRDIIIAVLGLTAIGVTAYVLWNKYGHKQPVITAEQKKDLNITFNRN